MSEEELLARAEAAALRSLLRRGLLSPRTLICLEDEGPLVQSRQPEGTSDSNNELILIERERSHGPRRRLFDEWDSDEAKDDSQESQDQFQESWTDQSGEESSEVTQSLILSPEGTLISPQVGQSPRPPSPSSDSLELGTQVLQNIVTRELTPGPSSYREEDNIQDFLTRHRRGKTPLGPRSRRIPVSPYPSRLMKFPDHDDESPIRGILRESFDLGTSLLPEVSLSEHSTDLLIPQNGLKSSNEPLQPLNTSSPAKMVFHTRSQTPFTLKRPNKNRRVPDFHGIEFANAVSSLTPRTHCSLPSNEIKTTSLTNQNKVNDSLYGNENDPLKLIKSEEGSPHGTHNPASINICTEYTVLNTFVPDNSSVFDENSQNNSPLADLKKVDHSLIRSGKSQRRIPIADIMNTNCIQNLEGPNPESHSCEINTLSILKKKTSSRNEEKLTPLISFEALSGSSPMLCPKSPFMPISLDDADQISNKKHLVNISRIATSPMSSCHELRDGSCLIGNLQAAGIFNDENDENKRIEENIMKTPGRNTRRIKDSRVKNPSPCLPDAGQFTSENKPGFEGSFKTSRVPRTPLRWGTRDSPYHLGSAGTKVQNETTPNCRSQFSILVERCSPVNVPPQPTPVRPPSLTKPRRYRPVSSILKRLNL